MPLPATDAMLGARYRRLIDALLDSLRETQTQALAGAPTARDVNHADMIVAAAPDQLLPFRKILAEHQMAARLEGRNEVLTALRDALQAGP